MAEGFVRNRASYANGDLGRVAANRIFYSAFIKKMQDLNIVDITNLLNKCWDFFKTDMTFGELSGFISLAQDLKMNNIFFHAIPGQSITTKPAGMHQSLSYFSVHKEEYVDILNMYMRPYATTPIYVKDIGLKELHTTYKPPEVGDDGSASDYVEE